MRFAPGNNKEGGEGGRRFVLETGPGHYVPGTKARDEQYAHRNNLSPRTPRHVYLILGRFAQRGPNKGTGAPHQVLQRVTSHRPRRLLRSLKEAGRVTRNRFAQ